MVSYKERKLNKFNRGYNHMKTTFKKKIISSLVLTCALAMLAGCGGNGDDSSGNDTGSIYAVGAVTMPLPDVVISQQTAVYEAKIDVETQGLSFDNEQEKIERIDLPSSNAKLAVVNDEAVGSGGDCWDPKTGAGASLSNVGECEIRIEVTGDNTDALNGNVIVHTSTNDIKLPITTDFVKESEFPSAYSGTTFDNAQMKLNFLPSQIIKIPFTAGNEDLNNPALVLPDYIQKLIDHSYQDESLGVDELKAGQSHTFQFKLKDTFDPALTDQEINNIEANLVDAKDPNSGPLMYLEGANLPKVPVGDEDSKIFAANEHMVEIGTPGEVVALDALTPDAKPTTTLTITNLTDSSMDISSISGGLPGGVIVTDNPCAGTTLAIGESCTITVSTGDYIDEANPAAYTDQLSINYTTGAGEQKQATKDITVNTHAFVSLSGANSIQKPLSGEITEVYTMTNDGPYAWKPSKNTQDYQINLAEGAYSAVDWNKDTATSTCLTGNTVNAGESCKMELKVTSDAPVTTGAANNDIIIKASTATNLKADSEAFSFAIGAGNAQLEWQLNGAMLEDTDSDFNIGVDVPQTIALVNSGQKSIEGVNVDLSAIQELVTENTCTGELAAGASCQIVIQGQEDHQFDTAQPITLSVGNPNDVENMAAASLNIVSQKKISSIGKEPGSVLTAYDGQEYLVVIDGEEPNGIQNPNIKKAIIDGTVKVATSQVTDMSKMFKGEQTFNQDISNWDTANVTNMDAMFEDASVFDQPIGGWNTSKVTSMDSMFKGASTFNQAINQWDTASVTSMASMFDGASAFNQAIGAWDVSQVTTMNAMFRDATSFNQDISQWKTTALTDMSYMFYNAVNFDQAIGGWGTSKVTTMDSTFRYAAAFNQGIENWNTSNVTNFHGMFAQSNFNHPIGKWNTSKVTNIQGMFYGDTKFNQDIDAWNTANVTNMYGTFWAASSFNQDIGNWNTAKVTNMEITFRSAVIFNQDLSGWDVSQVTEYGGFAGGDPEWPAAKQPQWVL